MSSKPENTFIAGVHKYLPDVYKEKMYNPYRSGTADVWYSGNMGDIWIEYKYIPKIPKSLKIVPALTDRQLKWLRDRHAEGRNIAVILGCPSGGVFLRHTHWDTPMTDEEMRSRIMTREHLAGLIRAQTGTSQCLIVSSKSPKVVTRSTKLLLPES